MVAPCAANDSICSFSGTGVRPSMRVRMTDWLTFGSVYSALSAAAAPQNEDTPGQISYARPSLSSLSICSLCAPYTHGSPVCRRTTVLPAFAAGAITAMTSSSVIFALLYTSHPSFL